MLFPESLDNRKNLGSISRKKVINDGVNESFLNKGECISDVFGADF